VLSRGYGRAIGQILNDEGRMLQARFPSLLQVQNKDRVAGALQLLDQEAQVVLLDDGFQHRRLFRDFDVVLMDVTRPFGLPAGLDPAVDRPLRAPLPRGFLREGLSALRRADHVVLTRCSPGTEARVQWLCAEIRKVSASLPIAVTDHVPSALWQDPTQPIACESGPIACESGWSEHEACSAWSGDPVDLVSAIGNPEAFQRSVEALGIQVASHRKFPDHHDYTAADLRGLGERAWITTAKDHSNLVPHLNSDMALPWVLDVRLIWLDGEAEFLEAIDRVLPRAIDFPGRIASRCGAADVYWSTRASLTTFVLAGLASLPQIACNPGHGGTTITSGRERSAISGCLRGRSLEAN